MLDDDPESNDQMKYVFDRELIDDYTCDYTFFTKPDKFLKAFTPDTSIAIIDYLLMAGINGLEVIKRALTINKSCYIILVSGQSSLEVVADASNMGAKYLDKNRKGYYTQLLEFIKSAIAEKKKEAVLLKSVQPISDDNSATN